VKPNIYQHYEKTIQFLNATHSGCQTAAAAEGVVEVVAAAVSHQQQQRRQRLQ